MTPLGTVRFENGPERKLVGLRKKMTMAEAPKECPALWMAFGAKGPIANQTEQVAYGVNCQTDMDAGTFEYMVAGEVPDFVDGDGWDRLVLPPAHYAVFPHEGPVSTIGQTYQAIFGQWAPSSGYQLEEKPIYERYGPGYDVQKNEGDTEIWVPVIKA